MGAIDGTAQVHPDAKVHRTAFIGPFCIVGPGVRIGEGSVLESHVVVGSTPEHHKVMRTPGAQFHSVEIGARCWIKEFVTIHSGISSNTIVGDNVLLFQKCHVAHDCVVEEDAIVAGQATLCGHVHVGKAAFIGAGAVVHQHISVGAYAMVGAQCFVRRDVQPGQLLTVPPAIVVGLNEVGLERWMVTKEHLDKEVKKWMNSRTAGKKSS